MDRTDLKPVGPVRSRSEPRSSPDPAPLNQTVLAILKNGADRKLNFAAGQALTNSFSFQWDHKGDGVYVHTGFGRFIFENTHLKIQEFTVYRERFICLGIIIHHTRAAPFPFVEAMWD